jgi:hypothetical protein
VEARDRCTLCTRLVTSSTSPTLLLLVGRLKLLLLLFLLWFPNNRFPLDRR